MAGTHLIVLNEPALAVLRRHRIFNYQWRGERWKAGGWIRAQEDCELEPYSQILEGALLPRRMGAFSYSHSELELYLNIGRYCSIARGVSWMGTSHPVDWATTSPFSYTDAHPAVRAFRAEHPGMAPLTTFEEVKPRVDIGHDVWIGEGAMIARDVTIGHGAIVGARSLVLKDVPPYAIVMGAPARISRYRLPEDLIARFLEIEWWRFAPDVLQDLPLARPAAFLEGLQARIEAGAQPMRLKPFTLGELIEAALQAGRPS